MMSTQALPELPAAEKKRRAYRIALMTYGFVIISFVSVIVLAVTTTMAQERAKHGFKAITVKKPISFIDNTYLPQKK